jgi:glycosyltransferase involved in cell wall biosynthesis
MLADDVLAALRRHPDAPAEPDQFLRWCGQCDSNDPPGISRFLFALWRERPDLQDVFRGIYFDPSARTGFLNWAHHFAVSETGAPKELVPSEVTVPVATTTTEQRTRTRGVGVLGFLRATLGLGEAARRIVELLGMTNEPITTYAYVHTHSLAFDGFVARNEVSFPDVLISIFGPHQFQHVQEILGSSMVDGTHQIAVCFWESAVLPATFRHAFAAMDEIWVTSAFTKKVIEETIQPVIPIYVIPLGASLPVNADEQDQADADDYWAQQIGLHAGAEETVVVGQVFDYNSHIARKNPDGLVAAWKLAFPKPDPEEQMLVFKTLNADSSRDQVAALTATIGDRPDVRLIDGNLSRLELDALMSRFDVMASLHRAEGYGLTLLEAMASGIPVIASKYSGNLEFMNERNSWLIPCTETMLGVAAGPYEAGSVWGEPDIEAAAVALREVASGLGSSAVQKRVATARQDARRLIEGSEAVQFISTRLLDIRAR